MIIKIIAYILIIIVTLYMIKTSNVKVNGKNVHGIAKLPYIVLGLVFASIAIAIVMSVSIFIVGIVIGLIPLWLILSYFTGGIEFNGKEYKFKK